MRNQALFVDLVEQCLDSHLLCVGTSEAVVTTVVVDAFVDVLCVVAVEDKAVAKFVKELKG